MHWIKFILSKQILIFIVWRKSFLHLNCFRLIVLHKRARSFPLRQCASGYYFLSLVPKVVIKETAGQTVNLYVLHYQYLKIPWRFAGLYELVLLHNQKHLNIPELIMSMSMTHKLKQNKLLLHECVSVRHHHMSVVFCGECLTLQCSVRMRLGWKYEQGPLFYVNESSSETH